MSILDFFIIAIALIAGSAEARTFRVSAVAAIDGNVKCLSNADWLITAVTGPCDDFTPPTNLALGEQFLVNGKPHKIGFMRATQTEEDMTLPDGQKIMRGEWTCVAAESPNDIPSEDRPDPPFWGTRYWLFIPKCQPLN